MKTKMWIFIRINYINVTNINKILTLLDMDQFKGPICDIISFQQQQEEKVSKGREKEEICMH